MSFRALVLVLFVALPLAALGGCGSDGEPSPDAGGSDADPANDAADIGEVDGNVDGGADAASDAGAQISLRVMTMNIGTTPGLGHDADDNGYTQEMADITDEFYENSLSWNPAEVALTAFMDEEAPDIVAFQEGFWDPWCEEIDVDPTLDFVCRDYTPERALQVSRVMGAGFQAACGAGQQDNCIAVRRSVGSIVGCDEDVCAGGLIGQAPPSGCSGGERVGRVVVRLADGTEVVVVNVHGTSGFETADQDCRVDQFEQIFEDNGDGQPAARGDRNIVLGDLNTDPIVLKDSDPSAGYFLETVEQSDFRFHSPTEVGGPATYLVLRIDHVLSDFATGECLIYGSSPGTDPVLDSLYWDHRPVVCDLQFPAP